MAINGKVVLVTGAARGIGRGIALRLAKDGADIALVDMRKDKLEDVAKEVRELGRKASVFVADITDRAQVFAAVDHAEKELNGFDVMINNAGIAQVKALEEVTPEEMEQIFKVNVNGVLWGIQAAAAKFRARKQKGKIINASSIAGHDGFALIGAYSATKFAVRGLTQAAARELASSGITVNAYCPGIVRTPMMEGIAKKVADANGQSLEWGLQQWAKSVTLGRISEPEDVAACVSYLAGPDSDYMTGQALIIDGGMVFN